MCGGAFCLKDNRIWMSLEYRSLGLSCPYKACGDLLTYLPAQFGEVIPLLRHVVSYGHTSYRDHVGYLGVHAANFLILA